VIKPVEFYAVVMMSEYQASLNYGFNWHVTLSRSSVHGIISGVPIGSDNRYLQHLWFGYISFC